MSTKRHPPTFTLFFYIPLLLSFLIFSFSVNASDLEKEKRWADQVADSLLDGEAVMLNDGTSDFMAIDTRADDANRCRHHRYARYRNSSELGDSC